jgi:hypothetical protein
VTQLIVVLDSFKEQQKNYAFSQTAYFMFMFSCIVKDTYLRFSFSYIASNALIFASLPHSVLPSFSPWNSRAPARCNYHSSEFISLIVILIHFLQGCCHSIKNFISILTLQNSQVFIILVDYFLQSHIEDDNVTRSQLVCTEKIKEEKNLLAFPAIFEGMCYHILQ